MEGRAIFSCCDCIVIILNKIFGLFGDGVL